MKIDPRSARVALHYEGDEGGNPSMSGVPARDLTENDVARLVYVEHGDGLHGAAYQAAVDKKLDELRAGPYRSTDPDAAKKAAKGKTSAASAAPAPAPEESASDEPPAEPSADSAEGVNPNG